MSGFNPSGRKEDLSVKLRAHNLKNAKDNSKKLEQENRKMEDRLKELKMAMNREKEQRERQGGGFWQRGQTGTLNSYATDVLHDKSNRQQSSSKKKGVKVLKDEPLDLPNRGGGPGTMKYIAQRSPRAEQARDNKNKGAKCGQCEDRAASLTCVQCSEHYCAGCFAAFHLKGALKRHRSVPLHATGPRQCMSPRPTPPASSRSSVSGGGTSGEVFYQQADRYGMGASGSSSISPGSVTNGNSLLEGAYNESDSAASFQQALLAWRQGDNDAQSARRPRPPPVVSPVKSSVRTTEHSTSTTTDGGSPPVVKSAPHSLSYAQRLMLKQHRRTEIARLPSTPSPRDSSVTPSSGLTSVTPRLSMMGRDVEVASDRGDDFDDDDDERVDFHSLYEAMTTSPPATISRVSDSSVTVTDVTDSPKDQRVSNGESSVYTVQEVSGLEAWEVERQARLAEKQEQGSSTRSKRISKSRETTRVIDKRIPKSREVTHVLQTSSFPDNVTVPDVDPLDRNHSHKPSAKEETQVLSSQRSALGVLEEGEAVSGKPPPSGSAPQPAKTSKSRPPSARAKTPAKSRPASRAQSRADSRMKVEGLLTKAPSSVLQDVARRATDAAVLYQSPMEGFFLAGVKVEDQVTGSRSRPVTPATPAGRVEKLKVSNKLYAMSPRSWRPDSSLGEASTSDLDPSLPPAVLHYTYSGQLGGQPLTWNPEDSFGTPVPGEDPDLADAPLPPPASPAPSARQRKRWGTPEPELRPFSAERPERGVERELTSDSRPDRLRPNSSTGGAEPSRKQRRQLPKIDNDLDTDQRARAQRQQTDGWTGDDADKDPIIRQFSAHRTRSWVASQNSLRPDSAQWQTEVQEFVADDDDPTPRASRQQQWSARSARSRNSLVDESGRLSRAIVMEGEDLSKYDADQTTDLRDQNLDDREALDRLEWELASESGRITADGKISRLSALDVEEDGSSVGSRSGSRSGSSTVRRSVDQGYDITTKLRDDELSDGENEQRVRSSMDLLDEKEVRALR